MGHISYHGLMLALMGQLVIGSPQIRDGQLAARQFPSNTAQPTLSKPTSSNASSTSSSSFPLLTSYPTVSVNPPSCSCALVNVPSTSMLCSGEELYYDTPLKTIYKTTTEIYTAYDSDSVQPPSVITPPPPCTTFSCPVTCTRPFGPDTSFVSVTKKSTILAVPTDTPPSFGNGDLDSEPKPEPQTEPKPDGDSDTSDRTQPPGNPDPKITAPPSNDEDNDEDNEEDNEEDNDKDYGDGSDSNGGGSGDSTDSGPDSPPDANIKSSTTMDGVPITVHNPSSSIIVGGGNTRVTVTNNDVATTFVADDHTFTVNPSEIIYASTTFNLQSNPSVTSDHTTGGSRASTTSDSTRGGSDDSDDDDDDDDSNGDGESGTSSPNPTTTEESSAHSHLHPNTTGSKINLPLAVGTITAIIFSGIVGLL